MDRTELTRRFEVSIGNKQNFSSASVSENEEGREGYLLNLTRKWTAKLLLLVSCRQQGKLQTLQSDDRNVC